MNQRAQRGARNRQAEDRLRHVGLRAGTRGRSPGPRGGAEQGPARPTLHPLGVSRNHQRFAGVGKILRVAYLGPAYTYSHLAAIHRFGQSVELVPVATIQAVFEEVNRRHADFGIVPVENSTDGRVADTLDMFTRLPVKICGEVQMRIHHNLLGRSPRDEVREVYSRPQALSQCRNWLAKHLPGARTIEVTSTTTAAQLAQEKPGAAAIASVQAGIHYGLDVLAADIEDQSGNLTRFAVIGEETGPRTRSTNAP